MKYFKEWLKLTENVTSQKQAFVQLFRSLFPDADVSESPSYVKAVAATADRNIVIHWTPGLQVKQKEEETQAQHSKVKIDFFNLTANEKGDFVGDMSKQGLTPNALTFVKILSKLVRGLKQLDINILFDAVGSARADSYASLLKKAGYTLGHYSGNVQLWLANPVEGMQPKENPYTTMTGAAMKQHRINTAPPPVEGGIRLSF